MFVNIWGKNIWYDIYGAEHSDTLLYLHGGPGASSLDFVNQAKALSGKMKVVIFDQLGVLRSDGIAENESYSMEYQELLCKGWSHHLIHMTAVHLWQNGTLQL